MTRKTTFALTAALLALGLGACSRSEEPAPMENMSEDSPMANEDLAPPIAEPAPPVAEPTETANATVADDTPPAAAPAPDEQMMDDASASGMTARATRNDTGDTAEPVEAK